MPSKNQPNSSPWANGLVRAIHCQACNALYSETTEPCPVCGHQLDLTLTKFKIAGVLRELPVTLQGALGWSSFLLLDRMREEWERPQNEPDQRPLGIPTRFALVVLFWTFFEALMERFFEAAFADLPGELGSVLLQRFPSIGARLGELYKKRWGATFWDDLESSGFPLVSEHLRRVQKARNGFVHGNPNVIDEALVVATVEQLLDVQHAWMTLFNKRCTGMSRHVRIWEIDVR